MKRVTLYFAASFWALVGNRWLECSILTLGLPNWSKWLLSKSLVSLFLLSTKFPLTSIRIEIRLFILIRLPRDIIIIFVRVEFICR